MAVNLRAHGRLWWCVQLLHGGLQVTSTLGVAITRLRSLATMKSKHKLPPWLRPKTPSSAAVVWVGWYTEDEWAKVKACAIDPGRFESSYPEWVNMAHESLADLRAVGVIAEKFEVNADALHAWCLVRDKPNSAASRAEFVTEQSSRANASDA